MIFRNLTVLTVALVGTGSTAWAENAFDKFLGTYEVKSAECAMNDADCGNLKQIQIASLPGASDIVTLSEIRDGQRLDFSLNENPYRDHCTDFSKITGSDQVASWTYSKVPTLDIGLFTETRRIVSMAGFFFYTYSKRSPSIDHNDIQISRRYTIRKLPNSIEEES